jgi:hypothetical protein
MKRGGILSVATSESQRQRSESLLRVCSIATSTRSPTALPPFVPAVSENFLIVANSSLESGYLTAMS